MARFGAIWLALLIITEIFISIQTPRISNTRYDIAAYQGNLIDKSVSLYADKLVFNQKDQTYQYNQDYNPANEGVSGQLFSPKFTASFDTKNSKAITLTDSVNKVSLTLTPKFGLDDPKKDMNHLVYPMTSMNANVVYTARAGSVKEDIILKSYAVDDFTLKYDVKTDSGTELRAEKDGSLAVYGAASTILGNVTTSNEKDALLLQKVRAKAPKTQLLFTIPAPFVKQQNNKVSPAKVAYELKNGVLSLHVSNLKNATYPLSVDPSVYIESATKLMRGNNESNISFDVSNELIQKAQTTGARIDAWTSTNNLSNAVWGQGTAVMGGFIYSVGGQQGNSTSTTPYYTAGTSTYTVPTGITSITVQAWGAGGGGGAGNGGSGRGGNGGGGGYAKAVITVTPGESLDVTVGSAGNNGTGNGNGGDGGGFSAVQRSGTYLVQAGGGGGGGGARGTGNGGAGGVGGGSTGTAGGGGTGSATPGGGGGGGTTTTGGAGGSAGSTGTAGNSGAANTGGNGGGYTSNTCNSAVTTRGNGGTYGSAGAGGNDNSTCGDGGGGGGGRFGGGGGGSVGFNNRGAGGGGGGSDLVTGTSTVQTQGSGTNPGNSGDANNNGAGFAGTGGTNAAGASAGADGAVVISYTTTGSGVTNQVAWAKFNPTTNAIESPNPGQGSCVGWCTDSVYNLPTALTNLSLVAYNGFLYALGGQTSIGGTPQTYVYIAKIGANGEPQLWHPSGGTPTYWYQDTALSAARSMFGAVAYNNRLYILGGLTTSTTVLSSNTVQYANINPTGTLTTWTSTGMQALSPARYGLSAQVYNDTLYVIGGDTSFTGTPITTVEYSKLNNDGTMNTWVTASSLQTSGRLTIGGSFSTIWAGYIYVAGGCTAVDSNGYCTTMASDVQLASINADGSLAEWNTILGLTNQRVGHTLIAWQGGLYRLGGCRTQDTGTGDCSNTVLDVDYGVINQEGEASTVADSSASGTAPCSGGNPYDCDLPGTSIIGNVLTGSAIMNGYLYIWGGCKNTNAGCTSTSQGVMYTSIGSDGTLTKPASCGSWSSVDSYCYNTTSLPGEVGAPGVAVFNGFIYSVGGFTSGSTVGNIYYAQPSLTDGSISSWSSTTLASLGGVSTTVKYPYSFARANPASAGTSPGNLYILGGCTGSTGIGCGTYTKGVYKCNISTAGVPSSCSATGQMQLDQNIGAMAGTVYANYLYIIGGLATGGDLQTTRYAKVDNSNNIVDASTGLSTGNWTVSGNQMYYARRRGSGFGYNGFLYVVGGYDGTGGGGILADIEFTKINVSDGSLGTWQISSVNIQQRWGLALTVSNSYAYVIGGCIAGNAPTCNAGGQTNSVQTFQIYNNDSGAVQAYNSSANNFATSTDRWGASATVLNGYLYVAGGCTSATDCTATTSNVQKALISTSDGSIGTWSSTTSALPAVRAWGKLVNAGGYLYYLGGQDNTPTNQSTVYYAQPGGTGDVTSWSTATKGIGDTGSGGQARTKFGAAVWDDRIYVIGGLDGSSTVSSTVYYSPKLSSGGNITSNWTASNAFNVARYGGATTAYANNIYLFGGIDSGGNYLNDAQFATIGYRTGSLSQSGTTVSGAGGATWTSAMVGSTIQYADGSKSTIVSFTNSTTLTVDASKTVAAGTLYTIQDGSVNNWNYTTSIPGKIAQSEAFGANGYIYLVGGRSATSTCTPKTLVAPVSANTTIASGNNPTGVGTWFETNVRYSGDRYGAAVAYNGGKLYLMGGGCTAPLSSNRNYYATLKSQPQVAKYSRMIDTDSDVFPTKWLLNGLDNSIGARWNLKYRSMTNTTTSCTTPAMTTWGQETNYGPVSLGTAGTYTPLDGSGVNTNCARFFYLSVSIDASQTYGYPEDVQRGPTITDLSLFFTADPSKRLIHGKTFVDGQQQPLDTPF